LIRDPEKDRSGKAAWKVFDLVSFASREDYRKPQRRAHEHKRQPKQAAVMH